MRHEEDIVGARSSARAWKQCAKLWKQCAKDYKLASRAQAREVARLTEETERLRVRAADYKEMCERLNKLVEVIHQNGPGSNES